MSLLEKIQKSSDLKKLEPEQLTELAEEIRQEIITVVSQNGGHLASNLGIVELTLALHLTYDIPQDRIVWDVGHQAYVHKLLTGRRDRMNTIRQYKGLSGFPKRSESPADPFGAGHASTAISSALGLATSRDLHKKKNKVIAVIGDGALTGGLAFEGLNNAGASQKDMLVILNDNEMSISKNVGAMSKYLTNIMTDKRFNKLRDEIWELTGRFKRRDKIRTVVSNLEDSIKGIFIPGYLFDKLGFRYFGPIDGHDVPLLTKTLTQINNIGGPKILHVITVKGKGFAMAEEDATRFHGIGSFDKITGKSNSKAGLPAYTNVFGDTMVELASKNENIVAITAAMAPGTGLTQFAEKYPDRFFDVGIAEGHGVCFASGLAAEGHRPFVAIYSTFLQRAYDQIIHDAALQKLPVVLCLDRAGLVGEDGPTHHGCFDLSYLSTVPNLTIMAPKDGDEFRSMLSMLSEQKLEGPCAIRYPRGSVPYPMTNKIDKIEIGKWEILREGGDTAVIAVGTMVPEALDACDELSETNPFTVINARFIKPMDTAMLDYCLANYSRIIVAEENARIGGLGQMISGYLAEYGYKGEFDTMAIPDNFVEHGHRRILLEEIGLTKGHLMKKILRQDQPRPKIIVKKNNQLNPESIRSIRKNKSGISNK
ncbi:MAG: 1-deoxy-D-xylulose-5-phosphate synthase [Candidatus Zixiibacteriota bacterium]